jgi:hypothetical protein
MIELQDDNPVTVEELMVLTLAMVDALSKILIERAVVSEVEFGKKLLEERAMYQKLFNSTLQ